MAKTYNDDSYGEPCECIKELRRYLEEHGLSVYSEHGEPDRWVNVACEKHYTYEGLLRPVEEKA